LPCRIEIGQIIPVPTGYFVSGWVGEDWHIIAVSYEWTPLTWPSRFLL